MVVSATSCGYEAHVVILRRQDAGPRGDGQDMCSEKSKLLLRIPQTKAALLDESCYQRFGVVSNEAWSNLALNVCETGE